MCSKYKSGAVKQGKKDTGGKNIKHMHSQMSAPGVKEIETSRGGIGFCCIFPGKVLQPSPMVRFKKLLK